MATILDTASDNPEYEQLVGTVRNNYNDIVDQANTQIDGWASQGMTPDQIKQNAYQFALDNGIDESVIENARGWNDGLLSDYAQSQGWQNLNNQGFYQSQAPYFESGGYTAEDIDSAFGLTPGQTANWYAKNDDNQLSGNVGVNVDDLSQGSNDLVNQAEESRNLLDDTISTYQGLHQNQDAIAADLQGDFQQLGGDIWNQIASGQQQNYDNSLAYTDGLTQQMQADRELNTADYEKRLADADRQLAQAISGLGAGQVTIGNEDMASWQLGNIIDENSRLMQLARDEGYANANQRGLLYSSIAGGEAMDAMVRNASPIAQANASNSLQAKVSNANNTTQFNSQALSSAYGRYSTDANNAYNVWKQGDQTAFDQWSEQFNNTFDVMSEMNEYLFDFGKNEYDTLTGARKAVMDQAFEAQTNALNTIFGMSENDTSNAIQMEQFWSEMDLNYEKIESTLLGDVIKQVAGQNATLMEAIATINASDADQEDKTAAIAELTQLATDFSNTTLALGESGGINWDDITVDEPDFEGPGYYDPGQGNGVLDSDNDTDTDTDADTATDEDVFGNDHDTPDQNGRTAGDAADAATRATGVDVDPSDMELVNMGGIKYWVISDAVVERIENNGGYVSPALTKAGVQDDGLG